MNKPLIFGNYNKINSITHIDIYQKEWHQHSFKFELNPPPLIPYFVKTPMQLLGFTGKQAEAELGQAQIN